MLHLAADISLLKLLSGVHFQPQPYPEKARMNCVEENEAGGLELGMQDSF